jgi:hypothetical protein
VNPLQRFEKRLESMVNRTFARAFKSDLEPVELAAGLQRELDTRARILSRDRSLVPNVFVIRLSAMDHANLDPYSGTLTRELADVVREHARTQRYAFSGPVSITLQVDEDLRTGDFAVDSDVVAGVDRGADYSPSDTGERRAAAYVEVNGTVHPILAAGLLVGRGSDADLRIDDAGISRRHAEFRVHGEGEHAQVTVVDLGSTNGTVVDGVRVTQAPVLDGSRIVMGQSVLTVHLRDPRRSRAG